MVTREDVETLIKRGYYEEALYSIGELEDPLEKVELLVELAVEIQRRGGPEDWIPDIIDDAVYLAEKLKDPFERASAFASMGSALGELGYEESEEFFSRAIDEAERVGNPLARGVLLAHVAYYLALGGYTETATEVFNVAFDTIIGAETSYAKKVDAIIQIAELMESAGDSLASEGAIGLYRTAFDIFDKLHVNQKAAVVEKKLALAETVREVGLPDVRRALLEGRYRYALALVGKRYRGTKRLMGSLEIALWMKRMNVTGYPSVVEEAFEDYTGSPSQEELERMALILAELGSFERALKFALAIDEREKRAEALKTIAIELAKRHRYEMARTVAGEIPDETLREETLMEIAALEGGV